MFETLKKITRGFVGGLLGLLIGPFFTASRFLSSLFGFIVGIASIGGSVGFGAFAIAAGLGVGGISSAVKCAYASYHLGISEGVPCGVEDGIGINLSKLKRKIAAELRDPLQNNLRGDFPNENIHAPLLENKKEVLIDNSNSPVIKLTKALSEPFTDYSLLSDKEIEEFDKSASTDEKTQLSEYQSFFHHRDERGQKDTVCPLSQEPLKNLTPSSVITIEKKVGQKNSPAKIYSYAFALKEFKDFIQHENDDATNPVDRAKLNDPNIGFILGFPQWISHFVQAVRKKLSLTQSTSTAITINAPSSPVQSVGKAFFDKKSAAKEETASSTEPPTLALSPGLNRSY